ncbi:MAG TPA: 7TM diverse intracellular signaling domain-containing protein [Spirochaetota bacterium]|nr:7TM diverse intracellular signaling domain-containing protein [Spirochaetota bacterium]
MALKYLYKISLITTILILSSYQYLHAGNEHTVILDADLSKIELDQYIEYVEGVDSSVKINEISSGGDQYQFAHIAAAHPSFGYSEEALWIRFTVDNVTGKPLKWHLEFGYPIIDDITLFIPEKTGYRTIRTGDTFDFYSRPEPLYRNYVFPLVEPAGERTYYLRVHSQGSLVVPLTAWSRDALFRSKFRELPILWLYYGIMAALLFYNLFIFFSIRERSYLYLVFFIIGIFIFSMVNNGLAFKYLWPGNTWWANKAHPFSVFLVMVSITLFTRSFLNTSTLQPFLDRLLKLLLYIGIIGMGAVLVIGYYYGTQASVLHAMAAAVLLLVIGFHQLFKKHRPAVFYMIASVSFILGALLLSLRVYAVLPDIFLTEWGYQIGSSIMVLLFSLGIADKINTIRREREFAIAALKESESKYRSLVENAHDGIIVVIDEKPAFVNSAMLSMLNYSEDDFYAKSLSDLVPDTERGKIVLENYRSRMKGEKDVPTHYEAQMCTSEGDVKQVHISAVPITLGERMGTLAIITDISQLTKAHSTIQQQYSEIQSQYEELEAINEELLSTHNELIEANETAEREKEQLGAMLRSIGDAVITTDIRGTILLINRVAEELIGISQKDAEGKKMSEVLFLRYLNTSEDYPDPVTQVMAYGELDMIGIPLTLVTMSGNQRIVELNGAPIRMEKEEMSGVVLAIRDVTDKHQFEQEILKMSKLESLSVLAGGIAHDFNNLLTAILGNLSLAKIKMTDDSEPFPILQKIEQAAQRAVDLTRQLLAFAKGGEPIKEITSIVDLIRETVSFILAGSGVNCEFDIQDGLWSVDIDTGQISQVLNNIIINAMQAMPEGGTIYIVARNYEGKLDVPLPEGKYVTFSIEDEGPGIPKKILNKIFDPYFTTKDYGTGLGLASSYSIIKRHGGHIKVESQEDGGTTFRIYLRASSQDVKKSDDVYQVNTQQSGRVLIMDDEEYICDVSSHMLEYLGYEVKCVKTGEEAIDEYKKARQENNPFGAVIMDLTIPGGMGGKEAVGELLKIDPDINAIVSSGYSNDPIMANHRAYGFKDVITKPFRLSDITKVLNRVLG